MSAHPGGMSNADDKYRPAPQDRWIGGRTEPGTIRARTRFLYSPAKPDQVLPHGRTRHAFSRGAHVTGSDWPSDAEHAQALIDHVSRAVASFGDDADLEITFELAGARNLTSHSQVSSLPAGSVLQDAEGRVATVGSPLFGAVRVMVAGHSGSFPVDDLALPVTVLQRGAGAAAPHTSAA